MLRGSCITPVIGSAMPLHSSPSAGSPSAGSWPNCVPALCYNPEFRIQLSVSNTRGASRVNRVVSAIATWTAVSLLFVSCGGYKAVTGPPSGLHQRVLAAQTVAAGNIFPGLLIVNAAKDAFARASEIGAGTTPSFMTLSPNRATLLVYDAAATSHSVQFINTIREASIGAIQLPGPTTSIVIPLPAGPAYAAVPSALVNGAPPGAVEVMSLATGSITANIGVPGVQTVVANANGSLLLAFSADSNAATVVIPANINTPNPVTQVVSGFDRPVSALINGTTAYILNCGAQCGGVQASVQTLDLGTFQLGTPVSVDGATIGLLNGNSLYVAGTSPTNHACTGQTTAATTCGRLSVLDIGSMTVTSTAVITDGRHTLMDVSLGGQLFIGATTCTAVGNVNNPSGEVRGCLSIYNTSSGTVTIPPDTGDVTGLQGFTSRSVEYVVQGGNLRIYDTMTDVLQKIQITPVGVISDIKAVDFF